MDERFAGLNDLPVLIVEDEVMIGMMLEDMLHDFGCRVSVAPSIEAALAALRAAAPRGVLLDMNIKGEKPLSVAQELVDRSVPFILVTGYGAGDSDCAMIKAAPRLQKPFSEEELGRRMMEVFVAG